MKQTSLSRPTTRSERAKPWIILASLILIAAGFIAFFKFNSLQSLDAFVGNTFVLVVGLGVLTVILILIVFFYTLRKRNFQEHPPGTMMAWLQAHVYIGLLSLVVVFIHIWIPSFSKGWSSGKYALVVFALLVLSGIAWRIIYATVPPKVADNVGNLSTFDTKEKDRLVKVEIDKLLAGKSAEFRRAAQKRLEGRPAEKNLSSGSLPSSEQPDWNRFVKLADRLERYSRREVQQIRYARFLQSWKLLHIPLAGVLIILIGVHVWETLRVSNAISGGELLGLPPATACADCHADIVQEWKLAMHSQAQNAPVVIAQTNLALEKYPEFGRACNNCHAPIGTKLTGTPTLPIDVENALRSQANGTVVDDGVTCVICHTLEKAPTELRGIDPDFPVVEGSVNRFADMFGPPLGELASLPSTRHNFGVGFMTDSVEASKLCGTCHNVKVDADGDGEVTAFPRADNNEQDTDGDKQLDENELEINEDGTLQDLVLQTTFDEWEDYVADQGRDAQGCVDCHMPSLPSSPLVSSAPGSFFAEAPDRRRHSHSFVGVDYNLTSKYYEQPGMPPDARERVLEEREALLRSAMEISVEISEISADKLSAKVFVESKLEGHNLPTGFAFARQMWLEVFAETSSGRQVCLAEANVNGNIIEANCASGQLDSPQDELLTCDPLELADLRLKPSKNDERVRLNPLSVAPLDDCDPYLANFQKILTDGDVDGDEIFEEVPYQSLLPDIVKTRVRVSDQQAMDALNNTILVGEDKEPRDSVSYVYDFDLNGLSKETVTVTAIMHFRHLPPYFIKALDGRYPDGVTASELLENMEVVDIQQDAVSVSVP